MMTTTTKNPSALYPAAITKAEYLLRLAADTRDAGMLATASDLADAARVIAKLVQAETVSVELREDARRVGQDAFDLMGTCMG